MFHFMTILWLLLESIYQHKGFESSIQLLEFVLPYYHKHYIAYMKP